MNGAASTATTQTRDANIAPWENTEPGVTTVRNGAIQKSRVFDAKERNVTYELCRNGLHPMSPENTSVTTDGAKRCKACRRDQARKRKEKDLAQANALMEARFDPTPDPTHDFELPLGTLGRRWINDAQCVKDQIDMDWFFSPLLDEETAAYCGGCPVINLCFSFGVIGGEKGVWGGTTERQRELLSLSQRLTIRQSYSQMYAKYLGEGLEPSFRDVPAPAAMPHIESWREDTILRGIEASEGDVVAGQAGFDKMNIRRRNREVNTS